MRRRLFAKLLALGAGSLPFMQLQADETNEDSGRSSPGQPGDPLPKLAGLPDRPAPVNVEEFILLAKEKLPPATFDYITTGSEDELTLRENVEAFRRIKILPPLLRGVSTCDLSTMVLKQRIALPIMLAPVAGQQLYHPAGALASAKAAASAGTISVVSTSAGHSVEEVAAATQGPLWFQLYVPKDRGVARRLVERVERAGYQAIVVTVDLGERKDADRRNRFTLPKETLLKHLRDVGHEQLTEQHTYEELLAFNDQAWDLSLTWDFFDWLRSVTRLPLLVKGVLSPADARQAVSVGLDGIVVSNHGGRRLDGMPASIDMLAPVAAEVNGRTLVLMDGGVRRGADVLKALALGAKAVLIGRPYAWALAADGEAGVGRVLTLLREELENALISTGCADLSQIDRSLLLLDSGSS